jgi:predicted GNAT superfamily acetyltransferase
MPPRAAHTTDLAAIHALNQAAVPAVSAIPMADLAWLLEHAAYCPVIERDGEIAAFLLALRPGLAYTSGNYAWFSTRYADFYYIDRLAVAPAWRRQGLASALYGDVERAARAVRAPRLACEVNVRPYNAASLAFHERQGFVEVGRQDTDSGAKTVAMLTRDLATR